MNTGATFSIDHSYALANEVKGVNYKARPGGAYVNSQWLCHSCRRLLVVGEIAEAAEYRAQLESCTTLK